VKEEEKVEQRKTGKTRHHEQLRGVAVVAVFYQAYRAGGKEKSAPKAESLSRRKRTQR